ncbi:MAG: PspC domain-containing protein [Candidatus Paceibacterota bacterium]
MNIWVAGVLGGLAEYGGQDPLLYRLAFIIFLIATGIMPGLLIYVIAWILIPENKGYQYEVK